MFLFLMMVAVLTACAPKLTEKIEVKYPNGQPEVVLILNKSGECIKKIEYYDTGQVKMEGGMKDGKREGEWKAYFPDGRLQSHSFFKDGLSSGPVTVYYSNGNLRHEGFYKNDKHCGEWKWYDEQGNLLRVEDYGE